MTPAGYWPSAAPPERRVPLATVAAGTFGLIAKGAIRLVWWWPGLLAVIAAYVAVALGLYGHPYQNLWGCVGATVVALAWYGSPLRALEAGRRRRLSSSGHPARR